MAFVALSFRPVRWREELRIHISLMTINIDRIFFYAKSFEYKYSGVIKAINDIPHGKGVSLETTKPPHWWPWVAYIDYVIESALYGFLFTRCKTLENKRVSCALSFVFQSFATSE